MQLAFFTMEGVTLIFLDIPAAVDLLPVAVDFLVLAADLCFLVGPSLSFWTNSLYIGLTFYCQSSL